MITVVGSLNMDLVTQSDRLPKPGETVLGRGFKQIPGGKGGNQAVAAAKLGYPVQMIGCTGKDSMGDLLRESLKESGVKIENVLEKDGAQTGIASIVVDKDGRNFITVAPGANYELKLEDIRKLSSVITKSNLLLTQLETPLDTVRESLRIAKEAGIMTVLNPAPARELDDEILANTDILTPNETELELLSGLKTDSIENIKIAGKKLIAEGVKEIVVTLGSKGAMHITKDSDRYYEAYKVDAVDTTAAGDSFNGAMSVYLSQGKTMEEAIKFAMKVGALTVMREGAQTSLPTLEEVKAFKS